MSKNKKASSNDSPNTEESSVHSYDKPWNLDKAWITGVAGVIATLTCAIWFHQTDVLARGIKLFGTQLTLDRHYSMITALIIIGATMYLVELYRQYSKKDGSFITLNPDIIAKNHGKFFTACLSIYIRNLILLWLLIHFYETANEYGFRRKHAYYQPWFKLLELIWDVYLYGGFFYVLITRAYQHNDRADKRDAHVLVTQLSILAISYLPLFKDHRPTIGKDEKAAFQDLVIKMFFVPVMTVFFIEQFPHLVNNIGYIMDGLPNSIGARRFELSKFNIDLTNIFTNIFFTLHVALAWAGYTITSRWIKNTNKELHPTLFGWLSCLICYPPFIHLLVTKFFKAPIGIHMQGPSEQLLNASGEWIMTIIILLMLVAYSVWTISTVFFGLHFTNLSNRGILRTGPYAYVRHPAYASKIIGWALAIVPFILYSLFQAKFKFAGIISLGAAIVVGIYVLRAISEEKFLDEDPQYRAYKEQVKYRFIPKLI